LVERKNGGLSHRRGDAEVADVAALTVIGRATWWALERSAKPLLSGSSPLAASNSNVIRVRAFGLLVSEAMEAYF
jgi:hypothetical protein